MSNGLWLFMEEAKSIHINFPELMYSESVQGSPYVSGKLILRDELGLFVDSYSIRIECTESYPFQFPYVYETGGRIPNNIDWHIFSDGHCCFKSIPEEALLCKEGITLSWFIEKQVKPYFFNQKYRETYGYFLKERSHGIEGNIEFFKDIFRMSDLKEIVKALIFIKGRIEPGRVSECFCGSGLKYRKCHRDAFRTLNKFSDLELEFYTKMIIGSVKFRME